MTLVNSSDTKPTVLQGLVSVPVLGPDISSKGSIDVQRVTISLVGVQIINKCGRLYPFRPVLTWEKKNVPSPH